MHFNELELLTLKLALETFFKAQEIKSLHILVDKIVALNYFLKMGAVRGEGGGGYKKFTYGLSFQINLGTANKEKSNCDSRVPSQWIEQACRHRISSQDRFFRMEGSPFNVP